MIFADYLRAALATMSPTARVPSLDVESVRWLLNEIDRLEMIIGSDRDHCPYCQRDISWTSEVLP